MNQMNRSFNDTFSTLVKKSFLLLLIVAFFFVSLPCAFAQEQEHLKVYYVRHAEGGHNVVKKWRGKPKDQWPSYVGNANVFTPEGKEQIVVLTEKLKGMHFDFIAVSPIWRTRNTVLPYLKATGQKGEIWPELAETSYVPIEWTDMADAQRPDPREDLFKGKRPICLPTEEQPYFTFCEGETYLLDTNDKDKSQKNANNLTLAQKTAERIKKQFGKSGKSILLVGHGNAGSTLLRVLTGIKDFDTGLINTGIWMAEEQADGTFELKMLNSKPKD